MSKKHYQRGNPGLNPVRKELETIIGMGYRSHRVFEDWVGLMFHAFQRDDPPYLEIMGGYRNTAPRGQREADHFATATACLLEYMRAPMRKFWAHCMRNTRPTTIRASISRRPLWHGLWPA